MDQKQQLINAVLEQLQKAGRKKLACAEAFEIAREFKVEVIEIGRICNQHNIKICKCQLGCFA